MNCRTFANPNPILLGIVFMSFLSTMIEAQKLVSSADGELKSSQVYSTILPELRDHIQINGEGTVSEKTLIRVCVDITHPYTEDLELYLLSENGQQVLLSSHNGSSKANYQKTCFSAHAVESIDNAIAPFIGEYRPEQEFSALFGIPISGKWALLVTDYVEEDEGKLNAWSLEISNNILSREWRTLSQKLSISTIAKN